MDARFSGHASLAPPFFSSLLHGLIDPWMDLSSQLVISGFPWIILSLSLSGRRCIDLGFVAWEDVDGGADKGSL